MDEHINEGKQPQRPKMTAEEQWHYDAFITLLTSLVEKYGKAVMEEEDTVEG